MKNNKGFSLVELIIVIAIMAVLVGVLAPTYLQYVEKSKKSNDVSTVDSIVNAIEIGAIDPEVMTDSTTALTVTISDTAFNIVTTGTAAGATSKWKAVVESAVGTDVRLKSKNWDDTNNQVVFKATRDVATGKVIFTYETGTPQTFKDYATSLTKVKNS